MKKSIIMISMVFFGFFSQCDAWINYSSSISNGLACVNGVCVPCNGSTSIINGEIFCNGQKVTQPNNNNFIKGSGKAKTKKIPLNKIKKVSASGVGNLSIELCENPNNCIEMLSITADDNILEYLRPNMSNNNLALGTDHTISISPKIPLHYNVKVKEITGISAFGNIAVKASNITTNQLNISSDGSSSIDIKNINANLLAVDICGASKITIDGKVKAQKMNLSGAANYDARQLESNTAHVNVSGAATAHLNIIKKIKGYVSGASRMFYNKKYNPKMHINVSGVAKIRTFS